MGKSIRFNLMVLFVIGLLFIFLIFGFYPTKANAQNGTPELVLFLAANSTTPFEDLSGKYHSILEIPGASGSSVQITGDNELGRDVYSFANGGYLEIPDAYGLLKLSSAEELTIEVSANFAGVLPVQNPLNQMIFSKGSVSGYPRNYSFLVSWQGSPSSCYPGLNFPIGPISAGFYGPDGTNFLQGWKVYAFRIHKSEGQENVKIDCYINGQFKTTIDYIPTVQLNGNVYDSQGNPPPFNLGNGYSTLPEDNFQPKPFYGTIDYIRIYRGLVPVSQLNDNPSGPIPCFPGGDTPPVADDQVISTAIDTPVLINLTASDANCDDLTFAIVDQPDHGNLSGTGSAWTYTPDPDFTGSDSFTFKANDGTQDSNTAAVSIDVNAGPELILALSASSGAPFQDLSDIHQPVNSIPGDQGGQVFVDWDAELQRDVYSFANGGYLEIPDDYGHLKLSSVDELTIEVSANFEGVLPAQNPLNQMIFSKGNVSDYPRNYSFLVSWQGSPSSWYPGLNFPIGPISAGFYGPDGTNFLQGWKAYAFRIHKSEGQENVTIDCYINGQFKSTIDYIPTVQLNGNVYDSLDNLPPFNLGNGYSTLPEDNFQPKPFYGKIDYIRIYDGLLPVEELNDNPYIPIELPAPSSQPPVADDQMISTDRDTPVFINLTASDANGDDLTFAIVDQPDHGNLSGTGSAWTYTPDPDFTGSDSFTFKANDGTQDSNTATVSISVKAEPELIFALSASSGVPFQDLSDIHHPVNSIPGDQGGQVIVEWDADLLRDVYSFLDGGYLSIDDFAGFLNLSSENEMTIEVNVKITDTNPGYYCQDPPPSNLIPPDQMIFCKGPIDGYPRNYSLGFSWGRDDMRKMYCDPVGYFPGVNFGISSTHGFDSPMNTSELAGWRIYSFLIAKDKNDPNQVIVWCYKNRNINPYPAAFPLLDVDINQSDTPLVIGNGYATNGTNSLQPNPFFGKIDYIRIYKGLLPVEELNNDPYTPVDLPIPPNLPPVVLCQDVTVEAFEDCQAQASIDFGSYDPEGDAFTLTQVPAGPYPTGDTLVTLTATDDLGRTSMCDATVTVTDLDTDGDGLGDSCDPDIDGDGIQNSVDINPGEFSDEFSDISINGTTVGIITDRGGQILMIADSVDPIEGVSISASNEGGGNPALISECGGSAVAELFPGNEIIVTCGSVLIKVISGPVNLTFFGDNGEIATTSLETGNSMFFEPEEFIFTASELNPDSAIVLIRGDELTIEPGEKKAWIQIDIEPGSFPNTINPTSKGNTTVAILSNPSFDALSDVNRTSLTFGSTGNEQSLAFCSDVPEDVNGDGLPDLICHFTTLLNGFKEGDTKGILRGISNDDIPFEGQDLVNIVDTFKMDEFVIELAKIDFKKKPGSDKIHVKGKLGFDLEDGNGMDSIEEVKIIVGLFFETISVKAEKNGKKWVFKRDKDDRSNIKSMKIDFKKDNIGTFDLLVDKADLGEMDSWNNPVMFNIQIGDDIGIQEIVMKEYKSHWQYHKK